MARSTSGNFARRDLLLQIQADAQEQWEASRVFQVDAPPAAATADDGAGGGKFFGTFPYPYMNGPLHLGHAFSLSKLEFACAFHRLCGKRVLFPQAFHCTGMPIKACADKLRREIAAYGCPPAFPNDGNHGKTSSSSLSPRQWDILERSGVPRDQIPRFGDPAHWLRVFPPMAKRDIAAMGCGVDWRRSFVTTDVNPYYDSFVRWQFLTLRKQGRVVKDKRYAVFSPRDGQPCADHDRASGEGVRPQHYTLIKLEALRLDGPLAQLRAGRARGGSGVFLLAATQRPETTRGQTNCWVLPEGRYGAFRGLDDSIYVMTARAARNLSYQEQLQLPATCLLELTGRDLVGTPVAAAAPNCAHAAVYVLPLASLAIDRATGLATSVPGDSPEDHAALLALAREPALRAQSGVREEWVLPFAAAAPVVAGLVSREALLAAGHALPYSEPAAAVTSRSGDECVVALTDQWYLTYGEAEWLAATKAALRGLETYGDEGRRAFEGCLEWLNQWACSRSFGLGTRLPWDPQFLIESLSDSTIYMAYYTVAHILQGGDMYGDPAAGGPVPPEALTPAVWDHIFLGTPVPADAAVPADLLLRMRAEFLYWYPFDLRVSGKDLIQNHLAFCLYTHVAVWGGERCLPGGFRCNGHLLLDGGKMSKSAGNFKTLHEAVAEFSADAVRLVLAGAGDGMDDASFETSAANAAVLRLTKELAWVEEMMTTTTEAAAGLLRQDTDSVHDRFFANAIDNAVHLTRRAYDRLLFRDALKSGLYDLQNARDVYRFACGADGMSAALVRRYVEASTLMLAPVCPHTCEHVWTRLLRNPACSVLAAGWPRAPPADPVVLRASQYIYEGLVPALRKLIQRAEAVPPRGRTKGRRDGAVAAGRRRVTSGDVFVGARFVGWQETVLRTLQANYAPTNFPDAAVYARVLRALEEEQEDRATAQEDLRRMALPFAKFKAEEALAAGPRALDVELPFDEAQLIRDCTPYLLRALKLGALRVHSSDDAAAAAEVARALGVVRVDASGASPGSPRAFFGTQPVL